MFHAAIVVTLIPILTTVGCFLVNWRYSTEWDNPDSIMTGREAALEHIGTGSTFSWTLDPASCSSCTLNNASSSVSGVTCTRPVFCQITLDADGTVTSHDLKFRDHAYSYRWFVASQSTRYYPVLVFELLARSRANKWHAFEVKQGLWNFVLGSVANILINNVRGPNYSGLTSSYNLNNSVAGTLAYTASLSIWVLDPVIADQDELDGTANTPSQNSVLLTQQMFMLGQSPSVLFPANPHLYSDPGKVAFNQDCSCWQLELQLNTALRPRLLVTAAPIAVMGRLIRDTLVNLPRNVHGSNFTEPVELVPSVDLSRPKIFADPSHSQVAVLWYRQEFWLSQDGFVTVAKLNASGQSTVDVENLQFSSVALTNSRIGLLSSSGNAYTMDHDTGVLMPIAELSGQTFNGLRARDNFVEGPTKAATNDLLVAWSDVGLTLVGIGNLTATRQLTWPSQLLTDSNYQAAVTVHDVAFTRGLGTVGAALTATHGSEGKQVLVVLYDYTRDSWRLSVPGLSNPGVDSYNVKFVPSGRLSYVLWSTKTTFFFYHEGILAADKTFEGAVDFLQADEYIQQMEITADGDLVMLTTKNRIFFSRLHVTRWTRLTPWEANDEVSTLWMDGLGRIYSLTFSDLALGISRKLYPLDHELVNVQREEQDCQFLSLSHTLDRDVFVMDIGDSYQFTVDLLSTVNMNNTLQVIYEEKSFLVVNETTEITQGEGVVMERRVFTVSHQDDFRGELNYTEAVMNRTGVFSLEVSPVDVQNSCPRPSRVVVLLDVGCPRGTHIVLKRTSEKELAECTRTDDTFVLPKKSYRDLDYTLGQVDKTVTYDWPVWGCPILLYNARVYSPHIQLVAVDDSVLGDVEADFIVWEEYEQSGLNYNTSMLQVRCLRLAQQWTSLREANIGVPLDQIRGPWNYEDCFVLERNLSSGRLRRQYEVLNYTNHNAFSLTAEKNGIFVINIQVVDPNYSFCPLRTQFAIEIYGATTMTGHIIPLGASVSGFIVSTIVVLCISYYFFGKYIYQKELEL